MDKEKRRLAIITIFLLAVIFLGDFATGAIAIASGPLPAANTCTSSNSFGKAQCSEQIIYDNAVSTGQAGVSQTLSTSITLVKINETILVFTGLCCSVDGHFQNVTSVVDSQSNSYSRVFYNPNLADVNHGELELWMARTANPGADSITETFNASFAGGDQIMTVSAYENVAKVGLSYTSTGTAVTSGSLPLITIASTGSWIVGATSLSATNGLFITSGTGLVQRNQLSTVAFMDQDTEDTNSSFLGTSTLTYHSDWAGAGASAFSMGAVEIQSFVNPVNQEQANECVTPGDTCHINFGGKVSGTNSNQNIVVNTAYCTGITTASITVTGIQTIQGLAIYAGQSKNDTGSILLVQLYLSNNAPSTVFGSGLCASGGIIVSETKILFATSGVTLTAYGLNEYASSLTGAGGSLSGTVYGWLEITPQSVGNAMTGVSNGGSTIQYAQWGAINHSSLTIYQLK